MHGFQVDLMQTATDFVKQIMSLNKMGDRNCREYCLRVMGTEEILYGDFPIGQFVAVPHALNGAEHLNLEFTEVAPFKVDAMNRAKKTTLPSFTDEQVGFFEPATAVAPEAMNIHHFNCKLSFVIILESVIFGFRHLDKSNRPPVPFSLGISLWLGSRVLKTIEFSGEVSRSRPLVQVLFGRPFTFDDLPIRKLPRYGRLCFELTEKGRRWAAAIAVFDLSGCLISGRHSIGLFKGVADSNRQTIPPCPAWDENSSTRVNIRVPVSHAPVFYAVKPDDKDEDITPLTKDDLERVRSATGGYQAIAVARARAYGQADRIAQMNPLDTLKPEDAEFLRSRPMELTRFPNLLPWYLRAIDLCKNKHICKLPAILAAWDAPTDGALLSILGGEFTEPHIRAFVVRALEAWSDDQIKLYLLQLLHALQYSPEDDCPLALFLLKRSLLEPDHLGMRFFWGLRSLSALPWMRRRVLNLTVGFLAYGSEHTRNRCLQSLRFTQQQLAICQKYAFKPEGVNLAETLLAEAPVSAGFRLPIDPEVLADEYVTDKCKFMDSAKRPLLTTYVHREKLRERTVSTLLKLDDDLTQDKLVLQLLSVMDSLWKARGLDLDMRIYQVLPTGEQQGYIEVVPNAVTITTMQIADGTFVGTLSDGAVKKWLIKVNGGSKIPKAVHERFRRSLAAYCVATYVLGVGDRHCSNMMMQPDGHFFHIDFGHFLGHFKTKLGVTRDPDVYFSAAISKAIGKSDSKRYKSFLRLCGTAYNILRENGILLINLLLTMLGTGIPELQSVVDVQWLSNHLNLKDNERQAAARVEEVLNASKKSSRIKANDLAHVLKHVKSHPRK
jgi:phosphatidylinositol-4,5-bisphosphate 3-kinase